MMLRARSSNSGRSIHPFGILHVSSIVVAIFLVISLSVGKTSGIWIWIGSSSFHFHFFLPVKVEDVVMLADNALIFALISDLMMDISWCEMISVCCRALKMDMKAYDSMSNKAFAKALL